MNKFGLLILASSKAAQYGLYNAQNYIKYENFMMFPINTIKWWIIQFIYGIANFASSLLTHIVGVGSFVTDAMSGKGELGSWINGARVAAMTIAAAYLIYVGVKFVVAKQPPQFKNVALQLFVSIFLILSMSDITTTLVQQSTSWYNGFTQTDTSSNAKDKNKNVSDLPFQMLAGSTNDVEYLIRHNFDGTKAPAKKKIDISTTSIASKVPQVEYGFNDLTKTEVNEDKVDFDQVIQWPDVDGGGAGSDQGYLNKLDSKAKKDGFKFGWLIYQMKSYKDDNNKIEVSAPDIPRVGTTIFAFGGYPRFQVDFFPLVITLCSLIVAYAFASYAIIKSFLELGLMNVLGIFLFAVDLDSGRKTKQVIQAVFSTSLLVALQGLEIAFYKIAMLWALNAKDSGDFGSGATRAWVFVVFSLAATIMLITGSQKVTQFFGVDTGAQHGWAAAGSAMYAGKQIGKGAKGIATSPVRAANAVKQTRDNIGHALNTQGSMKRDAKQQAKEGARQQAINRMAGIDKYGNDTSSPYREVSNFGNDGSSGATKISDIDSLSENTNSPNPSMPTAEQSQFANTSSYDQTPKDQVASQIKQTPGAAKAATRATNKAAKASQSAIARQNKRNAVAGNMKAAAHNLKNIAQGKKADAPMRSLDTGTKKVDQLAKPYSSSDPQGEGLISKDTGLKKALGPGVQPSEKTKQLANQYQADRAALQQAQDTNAPKEELQMLANNVQESRQALDHSIDQDRQNSAYLNSTTPQKASMTSPQKISELGSSTAPTNTKQVSEPIKTNTQIQKSASKAIGGSKQQNVTPRNRNSATVQKLSEIKPNNKQVERNIKPKINSNLKQATTNSVPKSTKTVSNRTINKVEKVIDKKPDTSNKQLRSPRVSPKKLPKPDLE